MKAKIHITLKNGVLDPQGKAIEHTLHGLGYEAVEEVRQGKYIEVDLNSDTKEDADRQVKEMCERLLANTVIENYRFELSDS
ncbi:MAG: phosphoribosylformylglycinamidine synthase subunit PurS [Rickettsiales bacterium]